MGRGRLLYLGEGVEDERGGSRTRRKVMVWVVLGRGMVRSADIVMVSNWYNRISMLFMEKIQCFYFGSSNSFLRF